MNRLRTLMFICIATLLLHAPKALAQAQTKSEPVSVAASVPVNIYAGESAALQIIVRGTQTAEPPEIPSTDDYTVLYVRPMRSSQSSFDSRGGLSVRSSIVHVYNLMPKRLGKLTVPPIEVVVDGRTFTTGEVQFNVVEPSDAPEFTLTLLTDRPQFYVGEAVRLRLTLRLTRSVDTDPLTFALPDLPEGFRLLPHPDQPERENLGMGNPASYKASVNGDEAVAVVGQQSTQDGQTTVLYIDWFLIANTPGKFKLGSAMALFDVITGERRTGPTDFLGFSRNTTERKSSKSKPFELEVLALPTERRPQDFSGLVGNYSIESRIDQSEVSVGEPTTLSIIVTGPPPISLIPTFDFSNQSQLVKQFRVPRDPALPIATSPTRVKFQQSIRARSAEVNSVPPIEFSYFNTTSKKYELASSQAIPLRVKPSTTVVMNIDDDAPPSAVTSPALSDEIMSGPFSFGHEPFNLRHALRHPVSIAALAVPPACALAIAISRRVRTRRLAHEPLRRRQRAIRVARRELRRSGRDAVDAHTAASITASAFCNLAADWFGRPRQSLTAPEALSLLSTASHPAAATLVTIMTECDRFRFGPTAALHDHPASLIQRATAALDQAAQALREDSR